MPGHPRWHKQLYSVSLSARLRGLLKMFKGVKKRWHVLFPFLPATPFEIIRDFIAPLRPCRLPTSLELGDRVRACRIVRFHSNLLIRVGQSF